jgi:Flp pilus assembly protein CpaB
MADRFAPRFALEAGLLILLAVAAGFADLRPALIVLVMAIAWLIVSLIEWLAWRARLITTPMPPAAEPAAAAISGWDVEEILVPAEEVVAYSALDRGDALTTVLPADADEADVIEAKPRRRWRRRSE